MAKQKRFNPEKKVAIVREFLENKVHVSELSERYGVSPTMIYTWRKQLFEGALNTFKQTKTQQRNISQQIKKFEEKLQQKDSLISEIVSENIRLKKNLNGES